MHQAVESMSGTLKDMLSYQKISEQGKVSLSLCPFEVVPMLQQVAFGLEAAAKEKRLKLIVEYDPFVPKWVVGDPQRLKQVNN